MNTTFAIARCSGKNVGQPINSATFSTRDEARNALRSMGNASAWHMLVAITNGKVHAA